MSLSPISLAAVEYVNTLPFLYGIKTHIPANLLDIILSDPATCSQLFKQQKADIALVPVGALKHMGEFEIVTDYCIGSDGPVDTVALLSQVELQDIKSISLDSHSRTSASLIKILCKEYWRIYPTFISQEAKGNSSSSQLLIGDKVKDLEHEFAFKYDLGEAWKNHTQLPMVFATWIARKSVSSELIKDINLAFQHAITNLYELPLIGFSDEKNVRNYLTESIHYQFGDREREGMALFNQKCKELNL